MISRQRLLQLADAKFDLVPGGTEGQALSPDGWRDMQELSAVETVRFNGVDYKIRRGSEGADGFITIGANKIWLGDAECTIAFGEQEVKQIYLGTTLAYTARTSIELFNRGWVEGIMWQGNAFPRPQYTSMAFTSFDHVESGYMRAGVWNNSSSYTHYACLSTQSPVTVPAGANSMKIIVSMSASTFMNFSFGVQPGDVKLVTKADARGQLSDATRLASTTSERTYTLALADHVKGKTNLYPVINAWRTADASNELRVRRVWFE